MVKFLELCEKYFGTRDFYEILGIPKSSSSKEVKKAYHKLSLLVHPDRVSENLKAEATEKFKVLGFIHSVLSDTNKRSIYDETGTFDDESDEVSTCDWSGYWRNIFKEITVEDIKNYEKNYKESQLELEDIKKAYLNSKGNMDHIIELVPFSNFDEEPRIHSIIMNLIKKKEVPEYKEFTEEPEVKKLARKKRLEKEAKAAEKYEKKQAKSKGNSQEDLAMAILNKNKSRAAQADNFLDALAEKYAQPTRKTKKQKTQK